MLHILTRVRMADDNASSPIWLHYRKLTEAEKQGDAFRDLAPRNEPAVCLHCHLQVKRNDGSTKYLWAHMTDPAGKGGHGLNKNVIETFRANPAPPPPAAF